MDVVSATRPTTKRSKWSINHISSCSDCYYQMDMQHNCEANVWRKRWIEETGKRSVHWVNYCRREKNLVWDRCMRVRGSHVSETMGTCTCLTRYHLCRRLSGCGSQLGLLGLNLVRFQKYKLFHNLFQQLTYYIVSDYSSLTYKFIIFFHSLYFAAS